MTAIHHSVIDMPRLAGTDYSPTKLSRLMILGSLAEEGPMQGHQIRCAGELTNAEIWGGINGGAIYAELRRLDCDGPIHPIRAEQVGRRPARTIYEIIDEGRIEPPMAVAAFRRGELLLEAELAWRAELERQRQPTTRRQSGPVRVIRAHQSASPSKRTEGVGRS
jgi:DNA-binding PadR family transcriptional regulator